MPVKLNMIFQLILFAGTLWLGGHLLTLPSRKRSLRLTGLGTLAYGLILAIRLFGEGINQGFWILPALLWLGAALHLWPEEARWRSMAITGWQLALVPLLILSLVEPWFGMLPLVALLVVTVLLLRFEEGSKARPLIVLVSLFLTLSSGLMVLPAAWLSSFLPLGLLGVDLILLALTLIWWDALDQGHRMKGPLLRSFISSMYLAITLAALVVIGIALDGGMSAGSRFLLVAMVAIGVLVPVFSSQIEALVDRLVFNEDPDLYARRRLLRSAADNLSRVGPFNRSDIQKPKFVQLTRQALRDLSDLSKLTASPLTKLPMVRDRAEDNPLERAHQLKALLTDSVARLKPRTGEDFGVTEQWRYYNALYFPYVVGVSPYSRPSNPDQLDATTLEALEWFRREVPERTLYNWQATAAELVAEDLLSKLRRYSNWQ